MSPLLVLSIRIFNDSVSTMVCPHCNAFNPIEFTQSTVCDSCNKKLPIVIDIHDDVECKLAWHKTE